MFTREMMKALEEDGEKLRQLTGEDHGPVFLPDGELRWVNCEACGGSGEIIHRNPLADSHYQEPDEYAAICPACEGTGRDCVEVSPITADDLDQPAR
jgi:hypothetical protein